MAGATSTSDLLFRVKPRWTTTIGSGGVADGTTTTIPLASVSGLNDGEAYIVVINRVDSSGNKQSSWETVKGVLSGNNLTNCVRGVEGTAQAWSAGTVVEILMTAEHWNKMVEWAETEHKQDGTHGDITADSATVSGDVAVSGSVKTDTITEKTADAGVTVESVTHKDGTIILPEQGSTPSTPASGKAVVYVKSDGHLYYVDDSGTERRWYPPVVDNNVAYSGKDSGGTARSLLKVNGSDVLEIGDSNLAGWKMNYHSGCMVGRNTAQSISNATITKVQFNDEIYDPLNEYDSATNYRFTASTDGVYIVTTSISFNTGTGFAARLYIYKNGSEACYSRVPIDLTQQTVHSTAIFNLSKNDYIEVFCWQNSGGSLDLTASSKLNYLHIFKVA